MKDTLDGLTELDKTLGKGKKNHIFYVIFHNCLNPPAFMEKFVLTRFHNFRSKIGVTFNNMSFWQF